MKPTGYVCIEKEDLVLLSQNLQTAFNTFSGEYMKLTGYKDSENYEKLIEEIEKVAGIRLAKGTLRQIVTLKHNGQFQRKTYEAIDKFISVYTNTPRAFQQSFDPVKQKVFWSVNQGLKPGICINSFKGQFIEWNTLKKELEAHVITQCPRIIPVGAYVELHDFYGKRDWVIWIFDKEGNRIGSVWLGGNPEKNWYLDGLVRIGLTISDMEWKVYQILQRYSDGSYHILRSYV